MALLGAAQACGFDGQDSTALAGRDHDEDGVDDAVDPCPHLYSATPHADTDGDGVGNECDPDNTVQHRREFFDGFYEPPSAEIWEAVGYGAFASWQPAEVEGRRYVRQPGSTSGRRQLRLKKQLELATVVAGVKVEDVPTATHSRRVGVFVADLSTLASGTYGVCAMARGERMDAMTASIYLGDVPATAGGSDDWNDLVGESLVSARHTVEASTATVHCTLRRGTAARRPTVSRDGSQRFGHLGLYTEGLSAMFDYVFVVTAR